MKYLLDTNACIVHLSGRSRRLTERLRAASSSEVAISIRFSLERTGTPIGPNDLMIAATALANGLTVVTANEVEFRRVPELAVENWQ
jgi:predicted nucleic acid-binding protein